MRSYVASFIVLCWIATHDAAPAGVDLHPCYLPGMEEAARCGVMEVYENRTAATGRKITIAMSVLPAIQRNRRPDPLVLMAGGPGQGARGYAGLANRAFSEVRKTRDIVLIDARGTGDSNPLRCSSPGDIFEKGLAGDIDPAQIEKCLDSTDADPRWYANETIVEDLEEVLSRLGYDHVNLWGGSYGSRTALVYSRKFPRRVRTVILESAAPFELVFPLHVAVDSQLALDRLLDDCASDRACKTAFPNLREEFARLLEDLARQPETVMLTHPRRGTPVRVTLDRSGVSQAIRGALYVTLDSSLLPFAIHRAARGDYSTLAAMVSRVSEMTVETMSLGATLSVLCTEDIPRLRDFPLPAGTRESFLGESVIRDWRSLCGEWPTGPRPETESASPVLIPALVFSGEHDPVTPSRWGEQMARHFSPATHVVMAGTAHNPSLFGCAPRLMAEFIEKGVGAGLDLHCAGRGSRPPFVIDFNGPRP